MMVVVVVATVTIMLPCIDAYVTTMIVFGVMVHIIHIILAQ